MMIEGGRPLHAAEVKSHDDHRVAMALAIGGLAASGGVAIDTAECVDISFPGFFELLGKICLH
jgi:3-phosphoshikimate 1-carboxyvinyltransferase